MTRRDQIIAAARDVLEEDGLDAVTMRRLGDQLGIQAPSIYKHFTGRDEILTMLQADAVAEFGKLLTRASSRTPGGIAAMARAYRRWALRHPSLYQLMMRHPLDRAQLPDGLEATAEQPVLAAAGGDRNRARALWAVAHGLEAIQSRPMRCVKLNSPHL